MRTANETQYKWKLIIANTYWYILYVTIRYMIHYSNINNKVYLDRIMYVAGKNLATPLAYPWKPPSLFSMN